MPKWVITTSVIAARTYSVEAETKDAARRIYSRGGDGCDLISSEDRDEQIDSIAEDFKPSASA